MKCEYFNGNEYRCELDNTPPESPLFSWNYCLGRRCVECEKHILEKEKKERKDKLRNLEIGLLKK